MILEREVGSSGFGVRRKILALDLTLGRGKSMVRGHGRLAQLARAPARHAGGHRFESCSAPLKAKAATVRVCGLCRFRIHR